MVKSGVGLLNLGGANNYSGGTTVSGGILQMGNYSALGSSNGNLTVSGGQLDLNGNSPTVGAVTLVNGSIVDLTGGGSLTGASFNVQSGEIGVPLAGATASLTKAGNGLVTLAGANNYGGNTTVSSGTLQLINGATLPYNGSLTANGGLLDLGGYSPTLGALAGAAGVITDNSAGAGITTLTATGGNFSGSIQNGPNKTLALNLPGPGTLVLGGSNTYGGTTTVENSTLVVNGTHTGGDAYTVALSSGAGTLGGAGTISGTNTVTLYNGAAISPGPSTALGSIGTLTLPNLDTNGTVTANFDLSGKTTAGGGFNDLINVTGTLNLAGVTTLSINPTAGTLASGGAYTLFDYGTLAPGSNSSLVLAPGLLGPRQTASFNYGTGSNSSITMTINGFNANLTWIGTSSTTWDQNDTSNLPWTGAPTSSGNFFATKDNVTFNNSALNSALTVNINGLVSPGSVTVTGTKNFVFTGPGDITDGTAVTVLGPGSLTIANNNDYTQGTFIQGGGKIVLGTDNALPIAGTVTLGSTGSNGTLDLAGYNQTLASLAVGPGATAANQVVTSSSGNATLTYNSAGATYFAGTIQDTASTTGGTLGLSVAGGLLNLSGSNTFAGGITLNGGTLQTGTATALQSQVINPNGGALDLNGLSATIGGLTGFGTLTPTNGTLNVGGAGVTSEFDGTLGGSLPLVKVGSGTFTMTGNNTYTSSTTVLAGLLALTGNNSYTGVTTISGGTLSASNLANGGSPSSIGESSNSRGNLVLNGGGVFQYTGATVNIDRGFTVGAGGGSIDVANGTQLQFGNSLALGGTLTMTDSGMLRLINYSGSTVSGGGMLVINQGTVDFGGTYFNSSPFGYGALNIQVNPGADLLLSNAHALGGDNVDGGTSWGVVSILGGTMTLDREQYIHGGTVNGHGRLVLSAGTVNVGSGSSQEFRNTTNVSEISTLAAAQPSVINVALNAAYSTWVLDVARGTSPVDLIVNGNIYNSYGITKVNNGILELTDANSYNGATTINGGTLQVGNVNALGTGALVDNSGALDLNGFSISVPGLSGSTGVVSNSAVGSSGTLTVGQSNSTSFGGSITDGAGQLALDLTGTGTLTLTGTSSFSGGTTIDSGTLVVTNNEGLGDGSNLYVGGNLSLFGGVVGASAAAAAPADSTAVSPIPEPGTLALLAAAAGLAVGIWRRKAT